MPNREPPQRLLQLLERQAASVVTIEQRARLVGCMPRLAQQLRELHPIGSGRMLDHVRKGARVEPLSAMRLSAVAQIRHRGNAKVSCRRQKRCHLPARMFAIACRSLGDKSRRTSPSGFPCSKTIGRKKSGASRLSILIRNVKPP